MPTLFSSTYRMGETPLVPLADDAAGPLHLRWPCDLRGVADHGPSLVGGFSFFLFRLLFSALFWMMRWQLHPDVRIRFSSSYPRFGCVSSTDKGLMDQIHVSGESCFCGSRLVPCDLELSSLAMVAALVQWSFRALSWQLHVCIYTTTISTMESFARLRLGEGGKDGGTPSAHASVCSHR
jgi:hypothetical protein